ncbi:hypothetical protein ACFUJR_39400, partial [Streptomyces sp. NPDC057271]|uniref:hypothetical protein n=1 Tax=unclassified Streptomyces TaxID=2593676 RepID=UPI0036306C41
RLTRLVMHDGRPSHPATKEIHMNDIDDLLHRLANTLNALRDLGYEPDPRNGVHIGPAHGPNANRHDSRVVWDEDEGRWTVAAR